MFDAYKRFFRFSGTEKGTWYKGMAFELLRSIFEALQFVALLVVLRALVEQNMTGATAWTALGIMAVSMTGAALCWYLAHNSEGHANYRMCGEKRIHIGERMKYMPMGYFNAQSLGSLTAAATSTMSDLESMSFAVIARTVVGMIRTTIFSLAIMCFDWRIGLVFFVGMLLFLWVNSRLLKKSRELSPERLAAQTKLVDAVLEHIQGMSVVRAFHGDKAAKQTLNNTIKETENQNFKLERKRIPYNVLEQIVLRVTSVLAILLSIWLFLQGNMSLFTCLMMVVSAFLVYSELESAGEMFFMLPMIDASIDRVEEIDRAPRMDEGGSVQVPKSHDISFDHVDFSYGDRKIIDDVSFTIPEGTTINADDGSYITPDGSGTTANSVKLDIVSGHIQWSKTITTRNKDSDWPSCSFAAITCDSTISDAAKLVLQCLGMLPYKATDLCAKAGHQCWFRNLDAERAFYSGGSWYGSSFGLASFGGSYPHSNSGTDVGFRAAFAKLPTA